LTLQGGFAGLIGAVIEGSGIPAGTTVTAIAATTLTLSTTATTGTFPNTPLRIFPHGAGNGTTTFTLPDFRGRAVVGRGDQGSTGNAGLITTAGGAGLDGTLLGRSGGVQGVTLTTTMIPGHTHPATATATLVSGATGNESADHTHSISFVSGVDNQNHTHAGDIWQGTSYANQAAPNSYGPQLGFNQSFGTVASGYSTGIQEQAHTHNIIGSTAGISVVHTHAIASLTLSATATVNANTGGDQLHSNTQPIRIENVVIKT
jgi:microcystin-dependent protein